MHDTEWLEIELPVDFRRGRDLAKSLRLRQSSIKSVCKQATVGREHFSQVLNSARKLTRRTWKRVEPFLSYNERQIVLRGTNVSPETIVSEREAALNHE